MDASGRRPEPPKRDEQLKAWARWAERRRLNLPNADWDDDDPDNPPPVKPRGLDKTLWFDVSPMRPSDHGKEPAMRFTQAMRDQQVYRETVADVMQESTGYQSLSGTGPPVA